MVNNSGIQFSSLPSEIHVLIAKQLCYPDLLSLRFTNRYFLSSSLIATTKRDRVEWLLERAKQGLSIPKSKACNWSSDYKFVHNREVIIMMRRRRQHLDCKEHHSKHGMAHCFVLNRETCPVLESRGSTLGYFQSCARRLISTSSGTLSTRIYNNPSWTIALLALLWGMYRLLCIGTGEHAITETRP